MWTNECGLRNKNWTSFPSNFFVPTIGRANGVVGVRRHAIHQRCGDDEKNHFPFHVVSS